MNGKRALFITLFVHITTCMRKYFKSKWNIGQCILIRHVVLYHEGAKCRQDVEIVSTLCEQYCIRNGNFKQTLPLRIRMCFIVLYASRRNYLYKNRQCTSETKCDVLFLHLQVKQLYSSIISASTQVHNFFFACPVCSGIRLKKSPFFVCSICARMWLGKSTCVDPMAVLRS